MRRVRAQAEEPAGPEPEDIAFCFDLALVTRDALEGYGRLLSEYEERGTSGDLRAAALTIAQRVAAYERLGFVKLTQLASLSDELAPFPALGVLRQLAAALVMLAQRSPTPPRCCPRRRCARLWPSVS